MSLHVIAHQYNLEVQEAYSKYVPVVMCKQPTLQAVFWCGLDCTCTLKQNIDCEQYYSLHFVLWGEFIAKFMTFVFDLTKTADEYVWFFLHGIDCFFFRTLHCDVIKEYDLIGIAPDTEGNIISELVWYFALFIIIHLYTVYSSLNYQNAK